MTGYGRKHDWTGVWSCHLHIIEESLQARPQSIHESALCVGMSVQEESIAWHVQEASLAVPLASMWQPTKYRQHHRHLPYFTVRITTRCWNPCVCLACSLWAP